MKKIFLAIMVSAIIGIGMFIGCGRKDEALNNNDGYTCFEDLPVEGEKVIYNVGDKIKMRGSINMRMSDNTYMFGSVDSKGDNMYFLIYSEQDIMVDLAIQDATFTVKGTIRESDGINFLYVDSIHDIESK